MLTDEAGPASRPPMLFYSRMCPHCSELLDTYGASAQAAGVRLILVDDKLDRLPSFITRVPALVVPEDRMVLTGDQIRPRLRLAVEARGPQTLDVLPMEARGRGGEAFSFIGGAHHDEAASANRVDASLFAGPAESTGCTGFRPHEAELRAAVVSAANSKVSDSDVSALEARRSADVSAILAATPRPPGATIPQDPARGFQH